MQPKVIRQPNLCLKAFTFRARKELFLSSCWSHLKALLAPFEFFSCIPVKNDGCCCHKIILKAQQDIFIINVKVRQVFVYCDRD